MEAGLLPGYKARPNGFQVGPGAGQLGSGAGLVVGGSAKFGVANINSAAGNGGSAQRLINVNPLSGQHANPFFPGDVGAVVVAGNGNFQTQGTNAFSSFFHVGGSYSTSGGGYAAYESNVTAKNVAGVASTLGVHGFFVTGNLYIGDGAAVTMTSAADYQSNSTFITLNSGTLAVTQRSNFQASMGNAQSGVTVTTESGFQVVEGSGGGTITNRYGVDLPILTAGTNNNLIVLGNGNKTLTAYPGTLLSALPNTYTHNYATPSAPAVLAATGTNVFLQSVNAFAMQTLFANDMTYKNDPSVAANLGACTSFFAQYNVQADTQTITGGSHTDFLSAPTANVVNGGTLNSVSATAFKSSYAVGTGATLTVRTGYAYADFTSTGAITTQYAIDIVAISKAGTNIGIRNAAATAFTPKAKTITAVSDSISIAATDATTTIRLNNTSGSSKTLTSAPTISDGIDGQLLILFNSSANDVVLQDQGTLGSSNLRLGVSTRTLTTRDSMLLMYSTTVGDWIELSFNTVI